MNGLHMAPAKTRTSLLCNLKINAFNENEHLEYLNTRIVLKLPSGLCLQSFTAFQIVSLWVPSLHLLRVNLSRWKIYPETSYFISPRSVVHKSDFFLSKSHEILMELFLSVNWKSVIPNISSFWFLISSWLLIQDVFKMQLLELFWRAPCVYEHKSVSEVELIWIFL